MLRNYLRRSLEGLGARLVGADTDRGFDGDDEDLAVSDLASLGRFDDRLGGLLGIGVVDDDFDHDLWEEIDGVFTAAVDLGVPFLAAETFYFSHGHTFDADVCECFFYLFEFEGLDDCFDQFHDVINFVVYVLIG